MKYTPLFVYGTFMRGFSNNELMYEASAEFV